MLNRVSSYAIACLFGPKPPVRNDTREEESCFGSIRLRFFFFFFLLLDTLTLKQKLRLTSPRIHNTTPSPFNYLVASFFSLAGLGLLSSLFFTDFSFPRSSSGLAVAGYSLPSSSATSAAVSGSRSAGCGGAVPAELSSSISLPSPSIIFVLVS